MSVPEQSPESPAARGGLRAYLQLLRLPNVFTAMADVAMGYLLTHPTLAPGHVFALLLAASSALYLAGMVLNDVYDLPLDRQERPSRPIPSGRIALGAAQSLGFGLLAAGLALAWLAAAVSGQWRPGIVATALAAVVWTYDRVLKNTPAAPLGMGLCRLLNVLLGMSAAATAWQPYHWLVAAGVGVYIVGVTWFARTEAHTSHRAELIGATLVMLAGLGLIAWYPWWVASENPLIDYRPPDRWIQFWMVIGALVAWRCLRAVGDPRPIVVQLAVKNCILSLIIIDAAACLASVYVGQSGTFWAALVLLLLLPSMVLGRWIYST